MKRVLSRALLVFVMGATVAVMMMMVSAASFSAAQEGAPESGGPTCSEKWLRDWYVSEEWFWYWWYRYCQDQDGEWFRAYHSWEWWKPVDEA